MQTLSVEFGGFAKRPVSILFDDESADRCFFLISDDSGSIFLTFAGPDFADIAKAIQQAAKDLRRDGWLGD